VKIANISPFPIMDEVIDEDEDYHLVLADLLLKHREYLDFYKDRKKRGDFVIMDNMAFEKPEGTKLDVLLEACELLGPDEVVLIDKRFDFMGTYESSVRSMEALQREGYDGQMMAVPQGRNWAEYVKCALALAGLEGVTTIGIIEETEQWSPLGRGEVAQNLYRKLTAHGCSLEYHFLGMTETMTDLLHPWAKSYLRGVDSAKLIVWGLYGHNITPQKVGTERIPLYPGRPEDYFHVKYSDSVARETIRSNIAAWRHYGRSVRNRE